MLKPNKIYQGSQIIHKVQMTSADRELNSIIIFVYQIDKDF